MVYVAPSTVTAGTSPITAAAHNIIVNDIIDLRAVLTNLKSTSLTTTTTVSVTTGGTYYDIPGLSVSITPTANTSKIMIWAQVDAGVNSDDLLAFRLVRDSTAVGVATSASSRIAGSAGEFLGATMNNVATHWATPMQFLDSPATTSAITYKVQGTINGGSKTIYVNRSGNYGDSVNSYRAVSTITVMEIPT